jgi:uracil-DNA glycosylase
MTLYDIAEGIRRCTACPLYKSRLLAVPGEGSISVKMMVIGDHPSEEDDRQGLPFCDESAFLDKLMEIIGIKIKDVFITNLVKCHPPNNKKPKVSEITTCKKLWLEKQIELIKPKIIVLMGDGVLNSFLNKKKLSGKKINEIHGKLIDNYFITHDPKLTENRKIILNDFKMLKSLIN